MNDEPLTESHSFSIKDCTLAAIATGRSAQNLRELGNELKTIPADSIYYHFWGGLLRPSFVDPEYLNDFATWAQYGLRDPVLGERLGIIDPSAFKDLDDLRQELVDLIEQRLDESEWIPSAKTSEQFTFIRSQIVVFDTGRRLHHPNELAVELPSLTLGTLFYHFIDARRREPIGVDDFRNWLETDFPEYKELCLGLGSIYPISSLSELRRKLADLFRSCWTM